ncbi:MAG: zf-HC2 domain-containing protein [Candidatus Methylomirabilales bacterium]|nr:zf-HC2 domain-containing protein [candidate division NC10 bacterium]
MRCEEIQNQLSAYLEDELEPAQRHNIEAHMEGCVRCRQELALLRRTISALQTLEEIEVSPRLTAAIQTGVSTRGRSRWRKLASRLFFPIHIKIPLEAMALLLISLGVVYLYRSTPELAQAPRPQGISEVATRERAAPAAAGRRDDRQEQAARKRPAQKSSSRQSKVQEEREVLKEADAVTRTLRKEAPVAALRDVSPLPEMVLKTANLSQAVSQIANIVERIGGKLLETRGEHELILAIPASSYRKFLTALEELGDLIHPPAEAPSAPSRQGAVTFSLRVIPE